MKFGHDIARMLREATTKLEEQVQLASGTDYEAMKRQALRGIENAANRAADIGSETARTLNATAKALAAHGSEAVGQVAGWTENALGNKPKIIMTHKVIMMGGRRAGKSTILSSILSQLRDNAPGQVCTIIDRTDYTQMVEGKPIPTLDIKQNEIRHYISKRNANTEFVVDMSPTSGKASYTLEISAKNTAVDFEFVDVPGEWMRANVSEHKELVEIVKQSDVFVVAIDTPFLMETDNAEAENTNKVYNRIHEITQALANIVIQSPNDRKLIALCPVKCEKWVRHGEADKVVQKVCHAYRDLINRWVEQPEVSIQIMPIQTVGGMEASRLLPAKLFYKDDNDRTGTSCSEDPLTGLLLGGDGKVLRRTPGCFVEDDPLWTIDYTDIPISWYKLNGAGFSPQHCEQPGFHILKFLVEKEEHVVKAKADTERQKRDSSGFFGKLFYTLFRPTFGQYLPIWRDVITELEQSGRIKTAGDGFCQVKQKVN